MKMKSIRFPPPTADDEIRAILDNRKTVTRRAVKPQPLWKRPPVQQEEYPEYWGNWDDERFYKAPCLPGDILYVRETWAQIPDLFGEFPGYIYRADYAEESFRMDDDYGEVYSDFPACVKWRPSSNMPREAARLFLRVTGVRVERLQEMTDEDIVRDFDFCWEAIQSVPSMAGTQIHGSGSLSSSGSARRRRSCE